MIELSLVIPIFNESERLVENITKIESHVRECSNNYEIILVDDGSRDESWQLIEQLRENNEKIRGIRLSRNFGKEQALSAGLSESQGDFILVMDADLEHPPSIIKEMYQTILNELVDVVEAVKSSRGKESLLYKVFANTFYRSFTKLTKFDMHQASDFKIFNRKVLDAILSCPEYNFFFRGISSWVGFSRKQIEFDVGSRDGDQSKWTMSGLMRLAINAITSFSSAPLHLISLFSIVFGVFSVALGAQTLYRFMNGTAVDGFTTVILLILMLGTFLMAGLGIIGEYLARIYDETKSRPRYIIKDKI